MKTNRIFVAHTILEGGLFCLFVAGFFYAQRYIFFGVSPASELNGRTALEVVCSGSEAPIFSCLHQTYFSTMHTREKCLTGRSTPASNRTPNETGDSITQKFIIEKAAKNRAYAFILSRGLLFEFRDFCRVEKFILRGFPSMRRRAEKIIEPLINQD